MASLIPTALLASAQEGLASRGYSVLPAMPQEAFDELVAHIGQRTVHTWVQLHSGGRTYLSRPDPVPMHTDHPKADLIAWRCEVQDEEDGTQLLVDGWKALSAIGDEAVRKLRETYFVVTDRVYEMPQTVPVVSFANGRPQLFFAPWIEVEWGDRNAVEELKRAIAVIQPAKVLLEPGEVLVVDNRRVLHGRGALAPKSRRRLLRVWIKRRPDDAPSRTH